MKIYFIVFVSLITTWMLYTAISWTKSKIKKAKNIVKEASSFALTVVILAVILLIVF